MSKASIAYDQTKAQINAKWQTLKPSAKAFVHEEFTTLKSAVTSGETVVPDKVVSAIISKLMALKLPAVYAIAITAFLASALPGYLAHLVDLKGPQALAEIDKIEWRIDTFIDGSHL